MDLSAAKIGEVYEFYVDDGFAIVNRKTPHTLRATVIIAGHAVVNLGWCAEDGIAATGSIEVRPDMYAMYSIPKQYVRMQVVPRMTLVASCINKQGPTSGHQCSECLDLFPYAAHDVSNGKYVCGLCKGRARMFGGA